MSLRKHFNQFLANRFPYPDSAIHTAQNATVMLLDDLGGSCGVITGPHTIVTAGHNTCPAGKNLKPRDITVCHPAGNTILNIDSIERYREIDVAVLRFKKLIDEQPAEIEFDALENPRPGVVKVHFNRFPTTRKIKEEDLDDIWKARNFSKGFLIAPETDMPDGTELKGHCKLFTLFHMRSRPGDSGAGMFLANGKLLTLNCGGDDSFTATGPVIEKFRALAQKHAFNA